MSKRRRLHTLHKNIQSTCDESGRLIWSKIQRPNSPASHTLLISSSCDQKLKLWNTLDETCLRTFNSFHQENIKCMQTNENMLITGSNDNTLQILTLTNSHPTEIKRTHTLIGHTDSIMCLLIDETSIFSGSWDSLVKKWNCQTGQCELTFEGHQSRVNDLLIVKAKEFLASASSDKQIKIWNSNVCTLS